MAAHHDLVQPSPQHSSYMGEQPWDPEPGVSSLDRKEIEGTRAMQDMLTLNGSFHPARKVRRRGEKSLAGFIADPAFRPKLDQHDRGKGKSRKTYLR